MPEKITANNRVSWQAIAVCLIAAIFYCYEYYLRVAPSVMSIELKEAYNISDAGLGFLSAFFYYAYTPMQVPVGMMMDKYGPRKILTLACILCVIGTYLFVGTSFLLCAQLGRFLIGFGSAFAFVGVLRLSASWLPARIYATMVGITSLLGMLGAIAGEVAMTFLSEQLGWKTTLYWSAICGVILTILIWIIIRNYPNNKQHTDLETTALPVMIALKAVLLDKGLWIIGLIGFFTYMPLSVFSEMWAIPFLEAAQLTREQSAIGSSLVFFGFALGSPAWGIISDLLNSRKIPLTLGSFLAAIVAIIIIFFPSHNLNINYVLLFSLGFFTSAEVLVFAIGNDSCKPEISATTISFINMVVMLGGLIFQPIAGYILVQTNDNYQMALISLPIGLLIAGCLCLLVKEPQGTIN